MVVRLWLAAAVWALAVLSTAAIKCHKCAGFACHTGVCEGAYCRCAKVVLPPLFLFSSDETRRCFSRSTK